MNYFDPASNEIPPIQIEHLHAAVDWAKAYDLAHTETLILRAVLDEAYRVIARQQERIDELESAAAPKPEANAGERLFNAMKFDKPLDAYGRNG